MLFVNILICLAIVFISYFFWKFCQKVFFIRKLDGIPGPKTLPFIGSFYHFLTSYEDFGKNALKVLQDYPSFCQVWLFSKLLIVISEIDTAKIVLYSKDCLDKSTLYKFIPPFYGMGLFTAPASLWTRIRIMAAPTFSSPMLQGFFNTFIEQSVTLTDELKNVGLHGNEIIYRDYIANCVLRIACGKII
ncbi:PREDICTED: cytochrome P450 4C1-like [Wasmannia auropunctata]|uniref:cytochrome P450 4C1-like n=1 Tax=Wasmannia auropunctata TaxID=64793 RepID=UPI0005EE36BC|nr:PREDICTED: cytochrome P450 4C1-like [Wasmannia auropunctata]